MSTKYLPVLQHLHLELSFSTTLTHSVKYTSTGRQELLALYNVYLITEDVLDTHRQLKRVCGIFHYSLN